MRATIVHSLIYAIPQELKRAKAEIIKPVKSSPNYEEYFPKFKILENAVVKEISGRKVTFNLKGFEDNLIIEAETDFDIKSAQSILEFKDMLFEESKKIAKKYNPSTFFEEYSFYLKKDYENAQSYITANKHIIAALLRDEKSGLTPKEITATLSNKITYGMEDLTVIDWDGAFLFDKEGEFKDSISIIELANVQLLNLRILDSSLQEDITKLKTQFGHGAILSFFTLPRFMREIIKVRVQSVVELDSIDNSLKLYGDWYSARIYDMSARKLYLQKWRSNVENKLNVLKDLYDMVAQRLAENYNLLLELTIVLLIVLEIVLFL